MKTRIAYARLIAIALSFNALSASAHTGHGAHSLADGLAHPLGADHLLAMVAVGVWSVGALPARQVWQGPAMFLFALLCGAALGSMGVALPFVEHAIALTIMLFGVMLAMSARQMPRFAGLGLISMAAGLHGIAHGAEAPSTGFAAYAMGFMLTTTLLHLGGIGIGQLIRRTLTECSTLALKVLGAALGGSGLLLFSQL